MAGHMGRAMCCWSVLLMLVAGAQTPAQARPARRMDPAAEKPVAAPAAEKPVAAPPAEEPIFEAAGAGTDIGHERDPQLLNQVEMLTLAKEYGAKIARALVDGERRREDAVRQRDSIKLSCIQDRLSGMKSMKKLSDDSLDATARPIIRADELHFRHEFRTVEMAHQRVLQLQRELAECVGDSLEVGEGDQAPQPSTAGNGAIDPGGTNVDVPPADRPSPASTYQ